MKIKEEKNERCVVTAFPMKCDVDHNIPDPLPQLNFAMGLFGPPGSGKTNLVLNLITKRNQMYNKKFDEVHFFSPSMHTLPDVMDLPPERFHETFNPEEINAMWAKMHAEDKYQLWVFDDMITESAKNLELMQPLILNRRHASKSGKGGLSVMIIAQTYNLLPLRLRKNLNALVLFASPNAKEQKCIHEEVLSFLDKKEFREIIKYIFREPHTFMFCNTNKPIQHRVHRNFNPIHMEDMKEDMEEGTESDHK